MSSAKVRRQVSWFWWSTHRMDGVVDRWLRKLIWFVFPPLPAPLVQSCASVHSARVLIRPVLKHGWRGHVLAITTCIGVVWISIGEAKTWSRVLLFMAWLRSSIQIVTFIGCNRRGRTRILEVACRSKNMAELSFTMVVVTRQRVLRRKVRRPGKHVRRGRSVFSARCKIGRYWCST